MQLIQKMNLNLIGIVCSVAVAMMGCESEKLVATSPVGATPTPASALTATPTPAPVSALSAAYDAEMYFTVSTAYDQTPTNVEATIPDLVDGAAPGIPLPSACQIPFGAAPGTPTALSHTCDFKVHEAQLYLSNTILAMGSSDAANCKYMKFYPYFYSINDTAPVAPGATPTPAPIPQPWKLGVPQPTVQCYGNAAGAISYPNTVGAPASESNVTFVTPGCFNGPATTMIPNFPVSIFLLQETEQSQQLVPPVIPSAQSQQQMTNRWVSNDSADITHAGASAAGEYLLGSMHGYTFQCFNDFGQLTYQLRATIGVESDVSGTPATVYKGWR